MENETIKTEEKFIPTFKPKRDISSIPYGEVITEETDVERILNPESVQEKHLEKIARGYIMGSNSLSKRKDIRTKFEDKVLKKIGAKGRYITDKLFELIEGIYIVDGKVNPDGTFKYYKQTPNLTAIMYVMDRAMGKPTVAEKEDRESQGTTTIEQIIKKFADGSSVEARKTVEVK